MSNIEVSGFKFLSSDGMTDIDALKWIPEGEIRGCVQIAHGVAEHKERYDGFARFLADNGFAVYANDHLGHGKSIKDESCLGFFSEEDGWKKVVSDVEKLRTIAADENPDVPYFLFGHSMGSFVMRSYLIMYPDAPVKGAVICGTGQTGGMVVNIGLSICKGEIKKVGVKGKSEKLDNLAFGGYGKKFEPCRTKFDWLSKNEENVDKYLEDPSSGFLCTTGLFRDMMSGIKFIGDTKNIAGMNKDVPVYLIAGGDDPVGDFGKGVAKVEALMKKAGVKDVEKKIYEGYRHEILNEDIKEDVMNDILRWIEKRM
ncbi:MAG: lysophospholipase [Christensenellaceae bacterium]|nr:lysophospholipase [Christensenellaceae bacterium]